MLSEQELLKRGMHREEPQDEPLLRQLDFHVVVVVRVFVDKHGRVVCARAHPPDGPSGFLDEVSVQVAKRWRFRHLRSGQRSVGMQGDLTFHLDH